MPELLYFCELLSNIKQVSVSIDSQDASGHRQPTAVTLHPSRRALTVAFGTETSHIILPTQIDCPSKFPAPSTSYRLPALQTSIASLEPLTTSPPVPWDASTLRSEVSIHCATCATRLVPAQRIQKWKNLPSEAWADLMDLWHCHKPHDEKGHADDGSGKYASVGRIAAEQTVGLVDPMYFLLCKDDCESIDEPADGKKVIKVIRHSSKMDPTIPSFAYTAAIAFQSAGKNEAETVVCQGCGLPLGIVDAKADGVRLMKWSLALGFEDRGEDSRDLESYTMLQWLSAQLLALVNTTGQRKFLVRPGASILAQQHLDGSATRVEEVDEGVHIWVFNPSTVVTKTGKPTATRAMKVYYQVLTSKSTIESLGDIESVYLPFAIYRTFAKLMEDGNSSLPRDLRIWGEWKAGWLERF
ncbi:hypothetical protein Dda_7498 [Drechslerella dactyloides]|uniref:Ubiquitin-conjugating enzyme E2-binding protein n=1 Tax=Drechslerella dactyloides TaxID=74499 RepID=A0AAD6NGS2_DREDA|nr:hypothetical protein Dda_7498 [Drechslerella dactyloides]